MRRNVLARFAAISITLCAATGPLVATTAHPAAAVEPATPEPKGWIIVDAGTGNVLEARDAHTPRSPASMVKVMTALTALDRLETGAVIDISAEAVSHGSQNRDPSGMAAGQRWSMKATLGALLVLSANDSAYALAEAVTPDVNDFGAAEAQLAARLGMNESTFNDPAGLDDEQSIGGGPLMSPYDVAIAVRNARTVPLIQQWASTATYTYTDPAGAVHNARNHNKLLAGLDNEYPDADGFKTGFTSKAGQTLAATATRNGRTIIVVVMNTSDSFGWARTLLDRGFATPLGSQGTTAEKLPAVAFKSLSQRMQQQREFLTLVDRPAANQVAASTSSVTRYVASTTVAKRVVTGDQSGLSGWLILLAVVGLLAFAIFVRREQVKRQRARRLAKRRAMQAALRRGSLPVVDGKYRAGMRTGPPVASNVRVRKVRDDA